MQDLCPGCGCDINVNRNTSSKYGRGLVRNDNIYYCSPDCCIRHLRWLNAQQQRDRFFQQSQINVKG